VAAEDHQRLAFPRRKFLFRGALPRRGRARCRRPAPDFLSHSHGEGFLRFFDERCKRQGIFIFDEPESALSPSRQIEFLKLLRRMDQSEICQVIMATHSPMLMAYPAARLLRLSKYGLEPIRVSETDHYRLMREFCADPETFIDTVLSD
jgi:predicted ATPase